MTAAASPLATWSPPARFDGFELVRPLGAGGMGSLHVARDTGLDRLVAVKTAATTDLHARERFVLEARAAARIQHPNVATVFRCGEVDGQPYLAFELVDGCSLDRLERPMQWRTVLAIGLGLARGLGAAHARGVLHRDVKPANVMISDDGEVKLIDFGLARIAGTATPPAPTPAPRPIADASDSDLHLTEEGSVVGTPLYLAPELWYGTPATAQSDIYALGVVLYQLMSELPHAHLRGTAIAHYVHHHELPLLSMRRPHAPAAFTALIDRCVRRDADARPASMAEIIDELEALAADAFPSIATIPQRIAATPRRAPAAAASPARAPLTPDRTSATHLARP